MVPGEATDASFSVVIDDRTSRRPAQHRPCDHVGWTGPIRAASLDAVRASVLE